MFQKSRHGANMMIALRHNFEQSKCQCRTVNPHRILLRIWPMSDCYNTLCYHTKGIFGSSSGILQVHGLSFASKTGPLPSIIGKIEVVHLLRPTRASQFARLLPHNFLTLSYLICLRKCQLCLCQYNCSTPGQVAPSGFSSSVHSWDE